MNLPMDAFARKRLVTLAFLAVHYGGRGRGKMCGVGCPSSTTGDTDGYRPDPSRLLGRARYAPGEYVRSPYTDIFGRPPAWLGTAPKRPRGSLMGGEAIS